MVRHPILTFTTLALLASGCSVVLDPDELLVPADAAGGDATVSLEVTFAGDVDAATPDPGSSDLVEVPDDGPTPDEGAPPDEVTSPIDTGPDIPPPMDANEPPKILFPGTQKKCELSYKVKNKICDVGDILGNDCAVACGDAETWTLQVSTNAPQAQWKFATTTPFAVSPSVSSSVTQVITIRFAGECGDKGSCGDPGTVPDGKVIATLNAGGHEVEENLILEMNANESCPPKSCL